MNFYWNNNLAFFLLNIWLLSNMVWFLSVNDISWRSRLKKKGWHMQFIEQSIIVILYRIHVLKMIKHFQVVKLNKTFHFDMMKHMLHNVMNREVVYIQRQHFRLVLMKFIQMIQKHLLIFSIFFLIVNMVNIEKHLQGKHILVFN